MDLDSSSEQMEEPVMRLWDELLIPSHCSWLIQISEYCSFTSNPGIFLQLKNNENSEDLEIQGPFFSEPSVNQLQTWSNIGMCMWEIWAFGE